VKKNISSIGARRAQKWGHPWGFGGEAQDKQGDQEEGPLPPKETKEQGQSPKGERKDTDINC